MTERNWSLEHKRVDIISNSECDRTQQQYYINP